MKSNYKINYSKGFLPGPEETKEAFLKRISVINKILESPYKYIPHKFIKGGELTKLNGATLLLKAKSSSIFHAASTYILEAEKDINLAIVSSPSKLSSLFISQKEVMQHELVHAKRAQFEHQRYEELIAYRTSKSLLRKILSPELVKTHNLILLGFTGLLVPISSIYLGASLLLISAEALYHHMIIQSSANYLKKYTSHYEEVLQAMTDTEIKSLSFLNKFSTKYRSSSIKFTSFRWIFIESLFGKIRP